MKAFRFAAAIAVALLLAGQSLIGQTALRTTTLAAALADPASPQGQPATVVQLASGSNVAVGQGFFIDAEYMTVQSAGPVSTMWNVTRGQGGTKAQAHASGATVFFSQPNNFYANTAPSGPCVSTLEQALPHIDVSSASIFNCAAVSTLTGSTAATWARYTFEGLPAYQPTRYTGWVYATAGALTIQPGVQFIGSGGALAMTLAAPAAWQDGLVMVIQASTAQAHTVTYTAGFYGTTTSSDVATFGGAIGDNFVIYASNGAWRIQSLKGVTIG